MRPCARPFLLPEVLSLLWSAALVQNERRMKTGLADRQTSIVCEHVWNKRQQHRGVFSLLGPAAHGSPPIQPDSLVFPSNFFLLSLCLASPSVPYIFFFFPPFYNILIQCFYTLSLCFSNAFRSAGATQFFSLELTIFTSGPDLLRVTNRQSASLSRGKTPAPESECLRLELKYNTDLNIKMD